MSSLPQGCAADDFISFYLDFIKSYPLGNIGKNGQRARTAKFSGASLRTEEDHSRI